MVEHARSVGGDGGGEIGHHRLGRLMPGHVDPLMLTDVVLLGPSPHRAGPPLADQPGFSQYAQVVGHIALVDLEPIGQLTDRCRLIAECVEQPVPGRMAERTDRCGVAGIDQGRDLRCHESSVKNCWHFVNQAGLLVRMRAQLAKLINDQYVFGDLALEITEGLTDLPGAGEPADEARQLTDHLQRVNHDRHLRVRYRPDGTAATEVDLEQRFVDEARINAGGVREVRLLDDHIGLLAVAPYLSPVQLAEPYVAAAFTLLAGVSDLIIDLRAGLGGTPETVALICGHLLGNEPVHLQDVISRNGEVRQFWSIPSSRSLGENVRVFVLTSAQTFSGCEELAYDLQALDRAMIIGETTGGGAHPCEVIALDDQYEVTIPVARSCNAVTGTNWEQVGVVPDVRCPADQALEVARAQLRTA